VNVETITIKTNVEDNVHVTASPGKCDEDISYVTASSQSCPNEPNPNLNQWSIIDCR
jgi:hypothetical protein